MLYTSHHPEIPIQPNPHIAPWCYATSFYNDNFLQPMPDFNNLSLQEHGGVADDPYGTHSSRPQSFYGGCGYSREYWRNLAGPDYHRGGPTTIAGPDYHRGGAKLSPGSIPRHGPSSPRHASPGKIKNRLKTHTDRATCTTGVRSGSHKNHLCDARKMYFFANFVAGLHHRSSQLLFLAPPCVRQRISR